MYSRVWGLVSEAEITKLNEEFASDHRSRTSRYHIFDGTDMEDYTANDIDISNFAANDIGTSTYVKNLKVALVSPKPHIKEGYQQYIADCQQVETGWTFKIFDTLEEARDWVENRQENPAGSPTPR